MFATNFHCTDDVLCTDRNAPQSDGEVIALVLMVSTCSQPLGNAMYGILFELCRGAEAFVVLFSGIVSFALAAVTRKSFQSMETEYRNS